MLYIYIYFTLLTYLYINISWKLFKLVIYYLLLLPRRPISAIATKVSQPYSSQRIPSIPITRWCHPGLGSGVGWTLARWVTG